MTEPDRPASPPESPQRPVRRLSRRVLTALIVAVVVTPPTLIVTLWSLFPVRPIPALPAAVTVEPATGGGATAGAAMSAVVVRNESSVVWDRIKVELRGRVGMAAQYEFNPAGPLGPGESLAVPTRRFVTHWGRPFADALGTMDHVSVSAQLPEGGRALTEVPIAELLSTPGGSPAASP